ncbi:MAG: CotH kinase family protein, partial [Clostridia bacterium]|nr:CotH kinase family protein [Clostridia bacterium]
GLSLEATEAPSLQETESEVASAPAEEASESASVEIPSESASVSEATEAQTEEPSADASIAPTEVPIASEASTTPTEAQTDAPTDAPSESASTAPTEVQTEAPSESTSLAPTEMPTEPTEETEEPTDTPTEPTAAPTDEYDLYDALFNIENKIELFLDIEEEELWKIQADYEKYTVKMDSKSPIYRKADLIVRINGEEFRVEEVGFRMKGDISRRDFYGKNGYINAVHFKLSFDETFDEIEYYGDEAKVWTDTLARAMRKSRTFATLEELDLKWFMNHDSTHVREYYAYQMMRSYGVLAPQSNVASMDFNETHMGLFQMVEPIDKIFIERNLPEEDWGGDLYKTDSSLRQRSTYELACTYGIEDKETGVFYNYNLKTNKKTSTHESLKNLLKVLNKRGLTQKEFEEVVDRDYFINFAAATFAIGNPDEMRHMAKNHYVYFLKSTGKAVFIIYDCDRVFGILCGWNPSKNGMTNVNPFHSGFDWSKDQPNKIFSKTVCIKNGDYSGWYLREYAEKLKEIYNSEWFNHSTFEQIFYKAKENYSSLAVPSVNFANMTEERQKFSLTDVRTDYDTLITMPGTQAEYNISMQEFINRTKPNMLAYIDEVLAVLDSMGK